MKNMGIDLDLVLATPAKRKNYSAYRRVKERRLKCKTLFCKWEGIKAEGNACPVCGQQLFKV